MKKTNLTISFECEKLEALKFYIAKKDVTLQDELQDTVTKLYEKHVPQSTREYIERTIDKPIKVVKKTNLKGEVADETEQVGARNDNSI